MQIADKVFIVTGGASGLGGGTAQMLVDNGGKVIIADVNSEAGQQKAGELGNQARFVQTDVTDEASMRGAVEAALEMGSLFGLVNCAGIAIAERTLGRSGAHDFGRFSKVIQINLIGTFNAIRLAALAMADNEPIAGGERGVIVNTASVAAFDGQIGQAAYAASKGGIVGLTLPIARDLSRNGIRVMTIAPGIFEYTDAGRVYRNPSVFL